MENIQNINHDESDVNKSIKKSILVLPVALFIVGVVIGFAVKSILPNNVNEIRNTELPPNPDTRVLTDPSEILSNPIFTEWYGAIKGRVVSKTNNSFTVDFEGNRLEIFIQPAITRIVDMTVSEVEPPELTLEQLPLNSAVEGSVTISKGTLTGNLEQKVVANGFSVTEK